MAKHSLYDNTPKMEHDDEGTVKVTKKAAEKNPEVKKEEGGLPAFIRHAHERRETHSRHELEHSTHDNSKGKSSSKKEIHARHEKEVKEMHARHEKELDASAGAGDSGIPVNNK